MHPRLIPVLLASLAGVMTQATAAQTPPDVKAPDTVLIGVRIESDRARVQEMIPRLRAIVAKRLSNPSKSIRAITLEGPADAVLAEAKRKACDYLLDLKVRQLSKVTVEITKPNAGVEDRPDARERDIPGEIAVAYSMEAVGAKPVAIHGRVTARPETYPLGPDFTAFESVVQQTAESAALEALKQLKAKVRM